MSSTPGSDPHPTSLRRGLTLGFIAYFIWGLLPLYFLALAPSGPWEIVAARILFSLVFCAILLTVTRGWGRFAAIARTPRILFTMALAAALIYVNWQVYVIASTTGQVVEAALGYFFTPVVTVFLGVFVQKEKLRPMQWAAVGVSIVAAVVLAVGYGRLPWIALSLAFSFGFYGLVKKRVATRVDAISGLTLETAWLTPVAIVQLVVVGATTGVMFGHVSAWHTVAMVGAGVITAIPLILFASASRHLPLVYIGFLQFIAPLMQLMVGVVVLHEDMPVERWVGFGIVWVSLILLMADMVVANRRRAAVPDVEPFD